MRRRLQTEYEISGFVDVLMLMNFDRSAVFVMSFANRGTLDDRARGGLGR